MKKTILLLGKFLEDFLILFGLIIIIATTYFINVLAGFYLLGFVLTFIGWLFARKGGG